MTEFEQLIKANSGRLQRLCRAYSDSPDSAADLQQEILLQLWRAWPGFAGRSSAATWLYRVALNTAISQLRRRPPATVDDHPDEQPSQEPGPQAVNEQQQAFEALAQALKAFNEVDRALMLLYLEQYSYQEIADVLGLSTNAVGVKVNRLKKRLAMALQEETA